MSSPTVKRLCPNLPGECKKTTFVVEVISERDVPVEDMGLTELAAYVMDGGGSGTCESTKVRYLSDHQAAIELLNQGSEPSFLLGEDWDDWEEGDPLPESQEPEIAFLTKYIQDNGIKMTEDRFWELVESVNWAEESCIKGRIDFDRLQKELRARMTDGEDESLSHIFNAAWKTLDSVVGPDRNPAGGGDDSHGDLMSHIIGMGREEFYAALRNYYVIEARGNAEYGTKDGYRESFSYIIP